MTQITQRAEELLSAYEQLIKAQAEIMAYCNENCLECPIFGKACDDGLFMDDERMKKIEPWADFVDKAYKKDEEDWFKSYAEMGIDIGMEERSDRDR